MEEICGTIENIVFSSEESGFTVAKIKLPKQRDLLPIVGAMPAIQPGETILCSGSWKHHPQHGRQFLVESFSLTAPSDVAGMEKYLASGLIKGIGPKYAEKIVGHFGQETFKVLDNTPGRLEEVEGIGEKRASKIQECWKTQRSIRTLMLFLQSRNIRGSYAQKIYKTYGDDSIRIIQDNPYRLARDIFGIGFKTADELAKHLDIEQDSPKRIQGGIEHMLWEISQEGHTCVPKTQLIAAVENFLDVPSELVEQSILSLEEDGAIIVNPLEGCDFVWIKPLYLAEVGIARELTRIIEAPCGLRAINTEKAIAWAEETMRIRLAKEQKAAIEACTSQKIHIITGGPGTGKSTITKCILRITEKIADKIILAAPTGRAAKRMQEITRKRASTIHSLLEYDFKKGGFRKNRKNPLDCGLIVVDEASMIDTQLMYHLLKAIPDEARVLFIGDIDQLPSVGPGNVLKDCITSGNIPVTILKQIFRQAKNSKIVTNAHRVNAGYFPDLDATSGDFRFIPADTPEEILEKIVPLIAKTLPARARFNPIDDIQVLTPMKRGVIGAENLNKVLQEALNPSPHALERMGRRFHKGDKVMQLRNNYDKKLSNGDVGRIQSIDYEEGEVCINFDGREVFFGFSELDELMLAYAVSIHKYQGSECPCIVIPIHTSHFKLLFRNLLYTGITRGKKLVVLIGSKKAVAIAVKNDDALQRHTGLKTLINKTLASTATV